MLWFYHYSGLRRVGWQLTLRLAAWPITAFEAQHHGKRQSQSARSADVAPRDLEPSPLVQFKQSLAQMSYDEQVRATQPDLPMGVAVQKLDTKDEKGDSVVQKQDGPAAPQPDSSRELLPRDCDDREGLGCKNRTQFEGETANRLNASLTLFHMACERSIDRIQSAARARAQLAGAFANFAIGLAAPGLGTLISSGFNRLIASGSISSSHVVEVLSPQVGNIALFTQNGAVLAAKQAARSGFSSLFSGAGSVDFVSGLMQTQLATVQALRGTLPDIYDDELIMTHSVYDADNLSVDTYQSQIDDAVAVFEAVGQTREGYPSTWEGTRTTGPATVVGAGGAERRALVRVVDVERTIRRGPAVPVDPNGPSTTYTLVRWLDEDLDSVATARASDLDIDAIRIEENQLEGQ